MAHFTKQEIEEIRTRLAATGVKDSQFPTATRIDFEDFIAIVQRGKNKKVSVSDLFENIGEAIFDRFVFTLPIYVKNGANILRKPSASADMEAHVLIGNRDVTPLITDNYFSWERYSKNADQDRIWNASHRGVGPLVHVTRNDVNEACTFCCLVPVEAIRNINL